jgi:integrase
VHQEDQPSTLARREQDGSVGRRKRHHTVTRALLAGFAQGRTITERVRGGAEFGQSIVNASVEADFYSFSDSARRYDTIYRRAACTCLDWTERTPVSAHVLRHTAITAVGRLAGYPIAQAFAGHAPPSVTGRYLHASIAEVAAAVAVLTGEAHPLADNRSLRRCGRR